MDEAPAQLPSTEPPDARGALTRDCLVVAARGAAGAGAMAALGTEWAGIWVMAAVAATTAAVERRALRQATRSTRGLLAWGLLAGLISVAAFPAVALNATFVEAAASGGAAAGWAAIGAELRDVTKPGFVSMLTVVASFGCGGAAWLCVSARLLRASRARRAPTPLESRALGALAVVFALLAVGLFGLAVRTSASVADPGLARRQLRGFLELVGITCVASVVVSLKLLLLAFVVDPLVLWLARLASAGADGPGPADPTRDGP